MDRFQEQTAAELVGNYYRRLYGDPYETFSAPDEPQPVEDEDDESTEPIEFTCQRYHAIMMASQTIGEMVDALKAHRVECPVCGNTQTTAQDDPLYPGLEQPVCCETLSAVA
jgi:hypothetical protein